MYDIDIDLIRFKPMSPDGHIGITELDPTAVVAWQREVMTTLADIDNRLKRIEQRMSHIHSETEYECNFRGDAE